MSTKTIRDWNVLPDSLISSAELSDDCVSKFTSLVRARDLSSSANPLVGSGSTRPGTNSAPESTRPRVNSAGSTRPVNFPYGESGYHICT